MSDTGHHIQIKRFMVLSCALTAVFVIGHSATAQDKGAPPWGEFLRQFNKDRLLKMPYHMDPEEGVKGLAAKIRARELDVPNRKRAIRYLADLDCSVFPEAKVMLLAMLNPEEEKWEEVRYEAAVGLRDMLARHSCNPNAANGKNKSGKSQKTSGVWEQCCQTANACTRAVRGGNDQNTMCHCTNCCDADTLNALAKTAYEMKENGCCYEPSLRVREMAVEAIQTCGVPCNYGPYYADGEEPGPPPIQEVTPKVGPKDGEVAPPATNESAPGTGTQGRNQELRPLTLPSVTMVTPISRLSGLCVVSLRDGQQVAPRSEFSATYRGRLYHFATEAALKKFNANPEKYAVAFGGCDPVHFVETQQAVEGRFLVEHEGRLFMFTSRRNHDLFKANPLRYSGSASSSELASAN